uniref:AAA_12 domain-containing protein n=1 Tax=Rhabditophanes sp. KR3021 TaxID=114890 RepID=A0AC35TZL7_9BILA
MDTHSDESEMLLLPGAESDNYSIPEIIVNSQTDSISEITQESISEINSPQSSENISKLAKKRIVFRLNIEDVKKEIAAEKSSNSSPTLSWTSAVSNHTQLSSTTTDSGMTSEYERMCPQPDSLNFHKFRSFSALIKEGQRLVEAYHRTARPLSIFDYGKLLSLSAVAYDNNDVCVGGYYKIDAYVSDHEVAVSGFHLDDFFKLKFVFTKKDDSKQIIIKKEGVLREAIIAYQSDSITIIFIEIFFKYNSMNPYGAKDFRLLIEQSDYYLLERKNSDALSCVNKNDVVVLMKKLSETTVGKHTIEMMSSCFYNIPHLITGQKVKLFRNNLFPMNTRQKAACKMVFRNHPISILESPAGTGGTFTTAMLISSVPEEHFLIVTETNKRADAIVSNLIQFGSGQVRPLRIYTATHANTLQRPLPYSDFLLKTNLLQKYQSKMTPDEISLVKKFEFHYTNCNNAHWRYQAGIFGLHVERSKMWTLFDKLDDILWKYYKPNAVVVTAEFAKRLLTRKISPLKFTRLIIDNSSQMSTMSFMELAAIYTAANVILIGDKYQLPVFKHHRLDWKVMESPLMNSIFETVHHHDVSVSVQLNVCYRLHPEIVEMISEAFYQDTLKFHTSNTSRLFIIEKLWFNPPKAPMAWIKTNGTLSCGRNTFYCINHEECDLVLKFVLELRRKNFRASDIGVVCMYRAQAKLIASAFPKSFEPDVNTVDSYQGREKEITIVCTSKTVNDREEQIGSDYIGDARRINIALTRSKSILFIFGDPTYLERHEAWRIPIEHFHKNGAIYENANMIEMLQL